MNAFPIHSTAPATCLRRYGGGVSAGRMGAIGAMRKELLANIKEEVWHPDHAQQIHVLVTHGSFPSECGLPTGCGRYLSPVNIGLSASCGRHLSALNTGLLAGCGRHHCLVYHAFGNVATCCHIQIRIQTPPRLNAIFHVPLYNHESGGQPSDGVPPALSAAPGPGGC